MFIKFEIDTRDEISPHDKAVLLALAGVTSTDIVVTSVSTPPPAKKTAVAKKTAAPAKKDFPDADERAAADAAPAVDVKPNEAADPELMDAALARASALMAEGNRDRVIAALAEHGGGAERVSLVSAANLPAVLAALTD